MESAEIWKDIPGYEGKYQASTMGRIKSLPRYVPARNHFTLKPFMRLISGRILRPGRYCKSGHVSVVLGKGTNGKPVHQLVMRTFVGEPPEGMEVLHKNGIPNDNRLCNLRYGTRTENILDVYKQGKPWRKLNLEQAKEIKKYLASGLRCTEIARMMGVSLSSVYGISGGRTFSWVSM